MRIEALQSIKYAELVIPSVFSSQLNVRKLEDTRFERTRKVEPTSEINYRSPLEYHVGKNLDLRV
jgi:hypothetical protein